MRSTSEGSDQKGSAKSLMGFFREERNRCIYYELQILFGKIENSISNPFYSAHRIRYDIVLIISVL